MRDPLLGGAQLLADSVQHAIDEPARFSRAELLRPLEGLVDGHLGRDLDHPEQLENALAQDVPVHHRHAIEIPVLRVLGDHLVDLLLVELGAPDEGLDEPAHLRVHRVAPPELVEVRLAPRPPPPELPAACPRAPPCAAPRAGPGPATRPSPAPPGPLPRPGDRRLLRPAPTPAPRCAPRSRRRSRA